MKEITVNNVNGALAELAALMDEGRLVETPKRRGARVLEYPEPVVTTYRRPDQKVLFDPVRDANPFFHLAESLWIFAGARDTRTLMHYLPSIEDYSDNGEDFNAAYGFRIRHHFRVDQLLAVVHALTRDMWTRRAYMVIGDPADMLKETRDVACNVTVFFNVTPLGRLDMLVSCRSNDAVWGAYGANAVQFGSLHQLVAEATELDLGYYRQLSNNFHIYPDTPAAARVLTRSAVVGPDPYTPREHFETRVVARPFLSAVNNETLASFLKDCATFVDTHHPGHPWRSPGAPPLSAGRGGRLYNTRFFSQVVAPMFNAFDMHRGEKRTADALTTLREANSGLAVDWLQAGIEWLERRVKP